MNDPLVKSCADYALAGMMRGASYEFGTALHFIDCDGRRVFTTTKLYEAAMFAEELYQRIMAVRSAANRGHQIHE
jgi:hypothetical protein